MKRQSIEKSGTTDGLRWKAQIGTTSGGQFTINWLDVSDDAGQDFPRYQQLTATHDTIESAVAEAEELARSIARPG
jgi:hypothetical protein